MVLIRLLAALFIHMGIPSDERSKELAHRYRSLLFRASFISCVLVCVFNFAIKFPFRSSV